MHLYGVLMRSMRIRGDEWMREGRNCVLYIVGWQIELGCIVKDGRMRDIGMHIYAL